MGAPQIILIVIDAFGLGLSAEQHGKPKEGTESFWSSLFAVAVHIGLLIWGGFFG